MRNAKWLFENHKWLKAQVRFLKMKLNDQQKANVSAKNEAISAMTLARPELSVPAQHNSQASITEHAALHWQEHTVPTGDNAEDLHRLLRDYEKDLQLYDILMTLLTEQEVWFVQQHYEKKIPIAQICLLPDNPFNTCCRSTLGRYRDRMLRKADEFITSNMTKGDKPCLPMQYGNGLKG